MTYDVSIDGKTYRLDLTQIDARWSCRLDGREIEVDAVLARPNVLSLRIGNNAYEVKCERVGADTHIWVGSRRFAPEVRDPRSLRSRSRAIDEHGPRRLTAPMPGKVVTGPGKCSRGWCRYPRCRGDEDAERGQIAKERNDSEDPGYRRGSREFGRCAGDRGMIRLEASWPDLYFSIPLLSSTFFA